MLSELDHALQNIGGLWVGAAAATCMLAVFATAVWGLVANPRSSSRYAQEQPSGQAPVASLRANTRENDEGLERYLIPQAKAERSQARQLLQRAGFRHPDALRNFYLVRVGLALAMMALALLVTPLVLPSVSEGGLFGGRLNGILIGVGMAIAAGFYAPLYLVRWRAEQRQQLIRRSFPDALDLLQVTIQAGLGLDAALQRVGDEMLRACPPLADEINLMVLELRAGKTREQALQDFSERLDLDYVRAFTTVLSQSLRFGTSISDALEVFSTDMRNARMMAAEEKANKLPVQMSMVLVLCMLPAVLVVALGPVAIRAIRVIMPGLG